jgi:hypothetical protein
VPFIIGMILGDVLGRIGFFRAAGAAILLTAAGFIAYRLVAANLGPDMAWLAGTAAPVALFGWAIWHPASSRFRLWIVDGVFLAARLAMWWAVITSAVGLVTSSFHLGTWLTREALFLPVAGVFWAVQWVLSVQVGRSHRIMGDRSVVEVEA